MWTRGFEPLASVWCAKCGAGDSVRMVRNRSVVEEAPVYDTEGITFESDWETVRSQISGETYVCEACKAFGDLDDMVTDHQNVAHETYKRYNPKAKDEEEEDDSYNSLGEEDV